MIINDSTPSDLLFPAGVGRGLNLALRGPDEYAYAGAADPFPDSKLVPRSEWQARIKESEERGLDLRTRLRYAKWKVKNQERTNYCWINAPTASLEMARIRQGQRHVVLSPASGGGPIKRFRNVGGWGLEALQWIAENGLCPVDVWPANAIDSKYYTEANKKLALNYRVAEWYEIKPRSLDHLISALFLGPVPVGYPWWGHEVTATRPVWLDGTVAIEIANSWGEEWGDDEGFGIIQGSRMLPDDAVAPRTAIAA